MRVRQQTRRKETVIQSSKGASPCLLSLSSTQLANQLEQLLYDLNIDPRPSAKSQGSVLLSYHTSAEDPQAGSTWLGRAIENATLIDSQPSLSPSPVPASQISDGLTPSLKKRLWWSILLRDRSLCIGLRRRSQVPVDESRCEWLMEEDFGDEMHASRVYDYRQKKRLLGALQEQCRFAVKVAGLVELVFSSGGLPGPGSGFVSEDERLEGILGRIGSIRAGLVDWGVTELSKSTPKSGDGSESESEEDDPAAILTNLTAVYYQYVLSTPPNPVSNY